MAARIGVVGLGVMGANLALNIAENGFEVAVWNRNPDRTNTFMTEEAGELAERITPTRSYAELVAALSTPRAVLIMVTAAAVDQVIADLSAHLEPGDTIIDGGNTNFHDTRRREKALRERGLHFIGMGVSGGEEGARHGPSIMVGGEAESYAVVRDIIEAIAAKFDGQPCAAHLGPDGAGHFVKTVHNGIEYGDMQMIAEVWGLMRDGMGRSPEEAAEVFARWNEGRLQSYLVEITAKVLSTPDPETGRPMVEVILDRAGQKGTGRWSVIEALDLGQSPSVIEAAVAARNWSSQRETRLAGEVLFTSAHDTITLTDEVMEQALLAAKIMAYSQGFSVLEAASQKYGWKLDMAQVAEVWRAGCIIRSAMLDEMAAAARAGMPYGMLIHSPDFARPVTAGAQALRQVVSAATAAGLPVPAFSAALAWFDTMRQGRGTSDLIQGQRDFFGAHGFERVDGGEGRHGPWALGVGY